MKCFHFTPPSHMFQWQHFLFCVPVVQPCHGYPWWSHEGIRHSDTCWATDIHMRTTTLLNNTDSKIMPPIYFLYLELIFTKMMFTLILYCLLKFWWNGFQHRTDVYGLVQYSGLVKSFMRIYGEVNAIYCLMFLCGMSLIS